MGSLSRWRKARETSSKEEAKFYINKIIGSVNQFGGEPEELFDLLSEAK